MPHKIDISDEILARAKRAAEKAGLTLDRFVMEAILTAGEDLEDERRVLPPWRGSTPVKARPIL
nr:hypothetical protein [uncultured Gellertiella sp.]